MVDTWEYNTPFSFEMRQTKSGHFSTENTRDPASLGTPAAITVSNSVDRGSFNMHGTVKLQYTHQVSNEKVLCFLE